jgi:hypothetical protein
MGTVSTIISSQTLVASFTYCTIPAVISERPLFAGHSIGPRWSSYIVTNAGPSFLSRQTSFTNIAFESWQHVSARLSRFTLFARKVFSLHTSWTLFANGTWKSLESN